MSSLKSPWEFFQMELWSDTEHQFGSLVLEFRQKVLSADLEFLLSDREWTGTEQNLLFRVLLLT